MAKRKGNKPDNDPQVPKDLPHGDDFAEPIDDFVDAVEFVDASELVEADEPLSFSFADEPVEPTASDSMPHVPQPQSPKSPAKSNRPDSVLDDELAGSALDAGVISGVYSSVIRQEPESAVVSNSEIIRAEPLSDSVALDPIPEILAMKADSEVRADDEIVPIEEVGLIDSDAVAVLDNDATSVGDVALPESAVREEALGLHEDAVGQEMLGGITDSSVSLKSFRGGRKSPEKEPVLDLDEAGIDVADAVEVVEVEDATEAFEVGSEDDLDVSALVGEAHDGSSVNLGQKPPRRKGRSGIDPLAESLESGVRLDASDEIPPHRAASTPSVEFDELIVDDLADVDLGADEPVVSKKKSAKLPRPEITEVEEEVVDVIDDAPMVAPDDIDIDALLSEPTEAAQVVDDEPPMVVDDEVMPVDDEVLEVQDEPVTTPKKKRGSGQDVPAPYEEPKKRGGWGSLFGGVALGALLTAGAGAGVYFGAPELIPTPAGTQNVKKDDPKTIVPKTPLQNASEALAQGNFAQAIEQLKDTEDKNALAVRGEARWLDYYKKQTAEKKALSKDDEDVKLALADLTKSENQVKLDQVQATLNESVLKTEIAMAKKEVETLTAKAKLADGAEKIEELKKERDEAKADAKAAAAKAEADLLAADKTLKEKLAEAAKEIDVAKASEAKVAKDRNDLEAATKAAAQELVEAKLLPADADPRKDLTAGIKAARSRAESPLGGPLASLAGSLGSASLGVPDAVKHAYDDAAILAEINFYRVREAFSPTPEQQLDRLAAAFGNRGEKNAAVFADVNKLAEMVLAPDAKASPAAKAKALYVQGLALRNQEKFAEARQALQSSVDLAKDAQAQAALAELTDPAVYYVPRVERYKAEGNLDAALAELNAALAAIPNHPRLMSERGLISLESGKNLDEPTKAVIRADAQNAAADPKTAAAGNFLLGRIEERSGNLAKAEEFYRAALKSARADDQQTDQIRISLGRLLLRVPGAAAAAPPVPAAPPAPPAPKKDDDNKAEKDAKENAANEAAPEPKVTYVHPLSALVAVAVLTQVPDDDESPAAQARVKEAVDLANELLKSTDKKVRAQGHFLLGEALSRQGQKTEGLRQYAKGIELLHPEANVSKLMDDHPAFSVPDSLQRANPLLAEKHYGIGLHDYYQRNFAAAESQFKQAVSYFDKDARYYYFLGLCQIEQGGKAKRDLALYAFEQASRLEANSRPNTKEINMALERVQGDRRAYVNSFRGKATASTP